MKLSEVSTNAASTEPRPASSIERAEIRRLWATGAVSRAYAKKLRGDVAGGVTLRPDGASPLPPFCGPPKREAPPKTK